jgi:hypothetical protein
MHARLLYSRRKAIIHMLLPWWATVSSAQAGGAPIVGRSITSPVYVSGSDQRLHLAYELLLSNFYANSGDLRIDRLAISTTSTHFPSGDGEERCAMPISCALCTAEL